MTLTLVATLSCDSCPATLVVDKNPLVARNITMIGRALGWRRLKDQDACPECAYAAANPQGRLAIEGAVA